MIVHNFDPVFIDLGFFQVRWYSIAYIVGIILGWIYANRIIKKTLIKNNFTLIKPTHFDDFESNSDQNAQISKWPQQIDQY